MNLPHQQGYRSAPSQRLLPVGAGPRRTHHPGVAAAVALLLGMVATAAGAGIGIRHLQKTGLTLETVLGLVLLAAGLLLLGYAATVAWRALHRWWRLVLLPAAVVVLQLVLSAALAFMYAVVPPTALGPGTPADVGVPHYRDVTFRTRDGVRLSAWYLPSTNGAGVVLEHGAGSTRTSTLPQAGVLARHGYGVLMVDARGHGRSGGTGMDLGWYGDQDTTAAVSVLARQPGIVATRIGVVGLSMGGEQAIGAAAVDPRIRAVVAEGATGRTAADNEDLRPDDYASTLERGLDRFTYGLTDLLTPASPPPSLRSSVAAARGTHFLVVAAGTIEQERRAAAGLHSADPGRVQVWVVPGAGHTGGLRTEPVQWQRHVLGFLDRWLLR